MNFRILNKISSLFVPASNIINIFVSKEFSNIINLFTTAIASADKRRVTDNVSEFVFRHNVSPIDLQRIGAVNIFIGTERQFWSVAGDNLGLFVHLVLGKPQRKFGNGNSEIVNFNAVKLLDRNFDRANYSELKFEFAQNVIFQFAQ